MTDRAGPTPEDFEDLRFIGDELEGELREAFYRMVNASERYAAEFAGTPNLLELIKSGSTAAIQEYAERLVSRSLIPNSLDFMNIMLAIMMRAGNATYASTTLSLPVSDALMDTISRFAMERGREHGGQWVREISRQSAAGLRDIMLDAVKRGVGTEQLGRELRGGIMLLESQRTAHDKYVAELNDQVRLQKITQKTAARLDKLYHRRLIAWRAHMISRTETMFAVHEGQLQGWLAQVRHGLLQPQRTWIEWVVKEDDRLCDRCAPMDGQRIRLDGLVQLGRDGEPRVDLEGNPLNGNVFVAYERGFPDGKPPHLDTPYDRRMERRGPLKPIIPVKKADDVLRPMKKFIWVRHPPLHPQCRCSMRLRFDP